MVMKHATLKIEYEIYGCQIYSASFINGQSRHKAKFEEDEFFIISSTRNSFEGNHLCHQQFDDCLTATSGLAKNRDLEETYLVLA